MEIFQPTSGGPTYKIYRALLTQTGTDPPVVTVLQNTLGGTVAWTYVTTGAYRAALTGVFTLDKTSVYMGSTYIISEDFSTIQTSHANANSIVVSTYSFAAGSIAPLDGILAETAITITVDP